MEVNTTVTAATRNEIPFGLFSAGADGTIETTTSANLHTSNFSATDLLNSTITSLIPPSSNSSSLSNSSLSVLSGTDPQLQAAGSEVANDEHSKGALYAWIGLGILLLGIVFILGFVFVFDKFLRKKFFSRSNDPESDRSKDEPTEGGRKEPTDLVIGEPNLPTGETTTPKDDAKIPTRSTEVVNGSSESLAKRKRQEKVDETNEVELKPL